MDMFDDYATGLNIFMQQQATLANTNALPLLTQVVIKDLIGYKGKQ
jgi:hypothetical protein